MNIMFDDPLRRHKKNEADVYVVEAHMEKNARIEELIVLTEIYMDKHIFDSDDADEGLAEQVCSLRSTLVRFATRTREIIRRDCEILAEGSDRETAKWASSIKEKFAKRI